MRTPYALIIFDGYGLRDEVDGNAVKAAHTPNLDRLFAGYPHTAISASGTDVGIEAGLMGNSEVGHMNLGGGRLVMQDIVRINADIASGAFFRNEALLSAVHAAKANGGRLHLMGLLSDGGVHSSDEHYRALLEMAGREGLVGDRVVFHAFLDGRDTPPRSAERYLKELQAAMDETGVGVIGTICGRFFAMDRDQRWERVEIAYRALVAGEGEPCEDALAGLAAAYAAGENDEFVKPRIVAGGGRVAKGDAVIVFNFRSDRVREITEAFMLPSQVGFEAEVDLGLTWVTMTEYKEGYPVAVAFPPTELTKVLGEVLADAGLRQLRIAETEKYAHVTFFFNGGREEPFPGEERILVPSPKVETYDQKPEMSAYEVTDRVVDAIENDRYDVVILNYANPDMVGHTGNFDAAVKAIEAVDVCFGRVVDAILAKGGGLLLTADHGNLEQMFDPETGQAHTAHTTRLVPLLLVDDHEKGRRLKSGGRLADVAPTLLELVGIEQPSVMNGHSLLEPRGA
ncbi:MAG: 2,3-bisphosphoglycerate-independent phosphoglycerate mutase, partial [Myxococcota bacterium]